MAKTQIKEYIHHCVYESGPMEGNKYSQDVSYYDIWSQTKCSVCGDILAPIDLIVAHIYEQLT